MPVVNIRFHGRPTRWERMALRCIGVGVVLLTERPLANLQRYFGVLWNVGCWTLAEYPVTQLVTEPPSTPSPR